MAKKTKDSKYNQSGFIIAGIVLLLIFSLNIFLLGFVYNRTMDNSNSISREMNLINSSNGMLSSINCEVAEIVGGIGQPEAHFKAISAQFETIDARLEEYSKLPSASESAINRLAIARSYINAYAEKMKSYETEMNRLIAMNDTAGKTSFVDSLKELYDQEITPIQTAGGQMLLSTIQIANNATSDRMNENIRTVYFLMGLLVVILIVCEIALYLFARFNKRSVEEIEHKTKQVAEASGKLMRSREKMEQAVATNFLTGFKNRYSLEQDIGERLASEQFNIAAFDLDNFKSINDMYGYDFGDEFLVQIAERLKSEFSQYAEIYNITGNEFVFVFHREVSDSQAIRYVENIVSVMNAPYTIFNLTVQLTVSAASYHYLAGDCLNVNSLLVKLDNVIRNAKRSGGGQILPVADL